MKILVDTHVALWLFNDYENLSQTASVTRNIRQESTNR
jgi:PIN domain nuclease of toxin-antitoxin system